MTRLYARKAAQATFIGLFSSVLALVSLQSTSLSARIVALVTLERFFPSVYERMSLKMNS